MTWYKHVLDGIAHLHVPVEVVDDGAFLYLKLAQYVAIVRAHAGGDADPSVHTPTLPSGALEWPHYSFELRHLHGECLLAKPHLSADTLVNQLRGWGAVHTDAPMPVYETVSARDKYIRLLSLCIPVLARLSDLTFEVRVFGYSETVRISLRRGYRAMLASKQPPAARDSGGDLSPVRGYHLTISGPDGRKCWGRSKDADSSADGTALVLRQWLEGRLSASPSPYVTMEVFRSVLDLVDDLDVTHSRPKESPYLHIALPPYAALLVVDVAQAASAGEEKTTRYRLKIADTAIVPEGEPWRDFADATSAAAELREWATGPTGTALPFDYLSWYAPVLELLADLDLATTLNGQVCQLTFGVYTATLRVREAKTQTPEPCTPLVDPTYILEIRDTGRSHHLWESGQAASAHAHAIRGILAWAPLPRLPDGELVLPVSKPPRASRRQEVLSVGDQTDTALLAPLSRADRDKIRAEFRALELGIANVRPAWPRDAKGRLAIKERAVLASFADADLDPATPRTCLVLQAANTISAMPGFTAELATAVPCKERDWREARERWTLEPPRPLTPAEEAQRALMASGHIGAALSAAGIRITHSARMLAEHGLEGIRPNPEQQERARAVLLALAPWRLAEAALRGRAGELAGSLIVLSGNTLGLKDVRREGYVHTLADTDWRDDSEASREFR